jgi:hypothetical protein
MEYNTEENLGDLDFDYFLDTTPKTQPMQEEINKLDLIKIKEFCFAKIVLRELKTSHGLRENIYETHN